MKYTKIELINEIHRFIKEHNKSPTQIDMCKLNGYIPVYYFVKYFGSWTNALKASNVKIHRHYENKNSKCSICDDTNTDHWRYDKNDNIICNKCYQNKRKHIHGTLNPKSNVGMGVITEYIVINVIKDCISYSKINFTYNFDLYSTVLGKINVKSSKLHIGSRNRRCWKFKKKVNAFIPDYYICIGFNNDQSYIEHVWVIPGKSDLISLNGINISYTRLDRAVQYEIDASPYNEIFLNLNIKQLEEFKNIKINMFNSSKECE